MSAAGAVVLLDEDDAAGAGAIVLLEEDDAAGAVVLLEDDVAVSGALASLDADGAGAVGAGETVVVLEVLAAGLAGGVTAVVLDFCSVQADTASVSAASTISDLYMWVPLGE